MSIERSTLCCLLAPSGGGKSTVLRLILGLHLPTSGRVLVFGRSPAHFSLDERRQLGYMPQSFVLYPELSVQANLDFMAGLYAMGWFGRGKRIKTVLQLVDLEAARNQPARELSGGMQRRLQLAAALIHNPQILVIDEPTAGIDPLRRAHFWESFRNLRDLGHTVIVATQHVNEAEYCDQVVVLAQGRLVASGSPEALRRQAFPPNGLDSTGHPATFESIFLRLTEAARPQERV